MKILVVAALLLAFINAARVNFVDPAKLAPQYKKSSSNFTAIPKLNDT